MRPHIAVLAVVAQVQSERTVTAAQEQAARVRLTLAPCTLAVAVVEIRVVLGRQAALAAAERVEVLVAIPEYLVPQIRAAVVVEPPRHQRRDQLQAA